MHEKKFVQILATRGLIILAANEVISYIKWHNEIPKISLSISVGKITYDQISGRYKS